ncbi:MAG: HAD family hydrolase [Promethearchaeota archaeon]
MLNNKKVILSFDLDNTLINNRKGIINSFNFALKKFKLGKINDFQIEKMIGLPLDEMFSKISNKNTSELVKAFREYYGKKGIYQARLLPGIKIKLEEFKAYSFLMGVITSKTQEMAEKILKILKINNFFDYVIGETEDRRILGKLDPSIKLILKKKYPEYRVIIIGDHPKDAMLATNLNCPFIGVLTGNHSAEDLLKYKEKETIIVRSVKDITIEIINTLIK